MLTFPAANLISGIPQADDLAIPQHANRPFGDR